VSGSLVTVEVVVVHPDPSHSVKQALAKISRNDGTPVNEERLNLSLLIGQTNTFFG